MADAKTELREIKRMGAVPQKNSGRGKHAKGDAILDKTWMVDIKEYSKSFGISKDVWAKTCTDAFKAGGLEPLLAITLGEEGNNKVRLVVISQEHFMDLKETYTKINESVV